MFARTKIVATAVGLVALLGIVKITIQLEKEHQLFYDIQINAASVYPTNEENRAADIIKATPSSALAPAVGLKGSHNVTTSQVTNISPPPSNSNTNISNTNISITNSLPPPDNTNTNISVSSWKTNLSKGIPVKERGKIIISYGVCCSKQAQLATKAPAKHDHTKKPYDVAVALSASLWSLLTSPQFLTQDNDVSIFIVLAYIKGNAESEANIGNLKSWLDKVNNNTTSGGKRIILWPYDVSTFDDANFACIRAGQIGRYYAHESSFIHENDFVMTSDADIFPINVTGIMPFLSATNPEGDYYRVFLKGWTHSLGGARSIPLLGIGQTAYDWNRSLMLTNAPRLKDALDIASNDGGYSWGFDQTLATNSLMNGELCYFPPDYRLLTFKYRVISQERSTASVARDVYTCLKPTEPIYQNQCLNSAHAENNNCHFTHFTPDATTGILKQVYNTIVASQSISSLGTGAQQTADLILGKDDEDVEELISLRSELRPGIRYDHRDPCTLSFERRKCNSERKPSLPFVSGDMFRCLADIIFDETNNYAPEDSDIACLHYLRSSLPELHRGPFLVFVKTDMICNNSPETLKSKIDDVIPGTYILVTHNSDFGANTDGVQGKVEGSLPKLVWWYGQNIGSGESRRTIPIGLENLMWNRQFPSYYTGMQQQQKSLLATASYRPRTKERKDLLQKLVATPWVDTPAFGYKASTTTTKHEAWLREQTKYRFVFSPPGNGIDCHRTWEMVLIGVIPILRSTIIDSIFASLRAVGRVLVVDDWDVVNQTLLENHWTKWGDSIVQEQKRWMEQDIDNNVMLAKHWVRKFSTKMEQLSKIEGRKNETTTKTEEEHSINENLVSSTTTKVERKTSIATLVGNSTNDIDSLARVMLSLDLNMAHDTSPLLVFNEGNLHSDQKQRIQEGTSRKVYFPEVSFNDYPQGFDPIKEESSWVARSKFGYQQMCSFWAYKIWLHPALDDYDTYMRFDTDSCFTAKMPEHFPGFPSSKEGYVYAANYMKTDQVKVSAGLFATAQKYIEENNISVKNPALYKKMSSPRPVIVYDNFEISNIAFFRQANVLNFTKRLAMEEPFGILRTRWGDAPIRTLCLAIFADESEVLWDATPAGYKHRHNACVLGETYQLNGAATGHSQQEELCTGNCVKPYKLVVYGG